MYIPNDDTLNYLSFRLQLVVETLDTQLNELTNQNSINVSKVVIQQIRKGYYENFGEGGNEQANVKSLINKCARNLEQVLN